MPPGEIKTDDMKISTPSRSEMKVGLLVTFSHSVGLKEDFTCWDTSRGWESILKLKYVKIGCDAYHSKGHTFILSQKNFG